MTTSSAVPTTAPTRVPDRTAAPADTGPWVGRPLDRADGTAKATGSATFSAEYQVPDIAHAVLVHATIARGRIRRIDTSRAEAHPGVGQPTPPGRRPEDIERVRPAVEPRDGGPEVDQEVEPDRARAEAEQRLELDDRERQRHQAEGDRDGQPKHPPLFRSAGEDRPEDDRDPFHPGRQRP